jgi:hypothetical protein
MYQRGSMTQVEYNTFLTSSTPSPNPNTPLYYPIPYPAESTTTNPQSDTLMGYEWDYPRLEYSPLV